MSVSSDLPVCVDEYYDDDDTIYCDCCGEVEVDYYGQECEDCRYGNEDLEDPDSWCEGVHYSDKDVLEFHKYQFPKNKKLLLYGIELEHEYAVEYRSEFQNVVNRIYKHFSNYSVNTGTEYKVLLKEDGSLDEGAELVTLPNTLKNNLAAFKDYFSYVTALHNDNGHAGMHVHVNKAALTNFTISKLQYFINARYNFDFVTFIAGRHSESYAKIGNCEGLVRKHWYEQKYNALNEITNTLEFRIFLSPTDYSTFAARLAFVEALILFTVNTAYTDLNYLCFINWIRKNRCKKYFYLLNLIDRFVKYK